VNHYEGLFILDTADSTDSVDAIIKALGKLISDTGGKVKAENKLDRRAFARVADKKHTGGFYVSLDFDLEPGKLDELRTALGKRSDVFRVQITHATVPVEANANA
jgi:ribosomal protein S6